jgi:hypothetical protein
MTNNQFSNINKRAVVVNKKMDKTKPSMRKKCENHVKK